MLNVYTYSLLIYILYLILFKVCGIYFECGIMVFTLDVIMCEELYYFTF